VLNPELLKGRKFGRIWPKARLRDRIGAIIDHGYEETRHGSHAGALEAAARTDLPISDQARRICRAMARSSARLVRVPRGSRDAGHRGDRLVRGQRISDLDGLSKMSVLDAEARRQTIQRRLDATRSAFERNRLGEFATPPRLDSVWTSVVWGSTSGMR
jgi:hypothetical protein